MRYTIFVFFACITSLQLHAGLYERFLFQQSIKNMKRFMHIDRNLACYKKEPTPGKKLFPFRDRNIHEQDKNTLIQYLKKTYKNLSDTDKKRCGIQKHLKQLHGFERTCNVRIQKKSLPSPLITSFCIGTFLTIAISIVIKNYIKSL